ncbi:hypothetical protein RGQ13_00350 [Thalassotalea psychrophila]|uniref:Uncharacterized protein n=1 Tax=Thalassotalea psychrophila TaxID=3065647 RepID=A0ABY9TUD5_9GAMM|nr:hypothetical protein RGQ13_00350 [Colwelliaceae bacterium SQ149]
MPTQTEINSEIDEQLQLLAGDIFIQLEDRFNQLAAKISEHAETDKQQALKDQKLALNKKNSAVHEKLSQSKHDSVNLKFSEIEQLKKKLLTYETKYSALKERAVQIETHLKIKLRDEQDSLEDLRLTKENRELLQSQLEPLNKQVTGLAKDKEKLLKDVEKLDKKYQQLKQSSEHDIAELKATFSDDQKNQQKLKSDYEQLSESNETLQAKFAEVETAKINAEQLTASLKKEHKTATAALVKSHNERLKVYEQASGSSTDALKTLETQLDKSQQTNTSLNDEINDLKSQIKNLNLESKTLSVERKNLVKAHSQEVIKLEKQHRAATTEQDKELKNKQKDLDKQQLALDKLATKEQNQSTKISEQTRQLKTLNTDISELNIKLDCINEAHKKALDKQQQKFDAQFAILTKDKDGVGEAITEFEQKLSGANADKQSLEQQITDLKSAHQAGLDKLISDSSTKEKTLSNSLKASDKQVTNLQQQVDKLTLSLNSEQQDIASATAAIKQQLNDTENLLEQSEKQQKSTWVQNNALKDKVANRDEQLEELRNKNSQINGQLISQREKSDNQLNAAKKEQKQIIEQANQQAAATQDNQQDKISDLELQLSTALKRFENHQTKTDDIIKKINQDKDSIQSLYEQLQHSSASGTSEVTRLESLLELERDKIAEYVQKNAAVRSRQDSSDDQIRNTLKALRDENHELKRQLNDEVAEMESKLTEYRLKFEYAQKQIALG